MCAMQTPICDFGRKAVEFRLPNVDGRTLSFDDVAGRNGTVIVFLCNHCPYVKASIGRLVEDARRLAADGIGFAALMSNDPAQHPEDSFRNMQLFAAKHDLPFPYLLDETQDVARRYGAICTPDFFGFNRDSELQYRGRLDEGRAGPVHGARRELVEAMRLIAQTGRGPADQLPSMGCSIKWREAA